MRVDLNADLGESFGPWVMGRDADLLDIITSANVACGFHASDPNVMAQTIRLASEKNVSLGAHPGFADLQGFGRRRMKLSAEELRNLVSYQLGAAQALAAAQGQKLHHIKLHGALANMCSEDIDMARACYGAVQDIAPDLRVMVIAETAQQAAAEELGLTWRGEIFGDRAYNDDATLVDRSKDGAVIHDPAVAGPRIAEMVREKAIITASGKRIPARIDTVCLHGDTADAVALAASVRDNLIAAGVTVETFE